MLKNDCLSECGSIHVICGPMFAGKTSELIKRLQTLGYDTIPEPVDEWKKYLEAFYTNPERYAFLFQMKILSGTI